MPFPVSEGQKRFARIRRVLSEIEGNAKLATAGPWSLNHGYVVKDHKVGTKDHTYGIAVRPDKPASSVFEVNPYGRSTDDMRHIATCNPERMLKLIEDVRLMMLTEPTELRMQLERANRMISVMAPHFARTISATPDFREHCLDNDIAVADVSTGTVT